MFTSVQGSGLSCRYHSLVSALTESLLTGRQSWLSLEPPLLISPAQMLTISVPIIETVLFCLIQKKNLSIIICSFIAVFIASTAPKRHYPVESHILCSNA